MQFEDVFSAVQPTILLLQLGSLHASQGDLAYGAYQQLLQCRDYLGHAYVKPRRHAHSEGEALQAGRHKGCPACESMAGQGTAVIPELWLGFVRKPQLLANLHSSAKPYVIAV